MIQRPVVFHNQVTAESTEVSGNGDLDMSAERIANRVGRTDIHRRSWFRRAFAAGAAFPCVAGVSGPGIAAASPDLSPDEQASQELERAQARVGAITRRPLVLMQSEQYQVVGDASEPFMKMTLDDCESLAKEFLAYYQEHGFDVKRPPRRLTLVVFLDERPYLEFARKFARGVSVYTWGFYSKVENWLVLFDFRNVPLIEKGAGHRT